jgi:uncharacterized protein YbjQ (UPF0145 family)
MVDNTMVNIEEKTNEIMESIVSRTRTMTLEECHSVMQRVRDTLGDYLGSMEDELDRDNEMAMFY